MKWAVRPEVADELAEAARWYRDISPSLSEAFFAEYEAAVARVQEYPRSYPVVHPAKRVRRALLHRFPYALFATALSIHAVGAAAPERVRVSP